MKTDEIIQHFYKNDNRLCQLLVLHSEKVRDKALEILDMPQNRGLNIDRQLVIDGSMLHDIGIRWCDAPGIYCQGEAPYIEHGKIGAEVMRSSGSEVLRFLGPEVDTAYMEKIARICERHTGAGLPGYEPETLEEKLVCLADKFYSKSGDPSKEKTMERVIRSMAKFGEENVRKFEKLCETFGVKND